MPSTSAGLSPCDPSRAVIIIGCGGHLGSPRPPPAPPSALPCRAQQVPPGPCSQGSPTAIAITTRFVATIEVILDDRGTAARVLSSGRRQARGHGPEPGGEGEGFAGLLSWGKWGSVPMPAGPCPALQVVEAKPGVLTAPRAGGRQQKVTESLVGDKTGVMLFTARKEQGTSAARPPAAPC